MLKKYYTVDKIIQGRWFSAALRTNKRDALKEYRELKQWYAGKPGRFIRLVKTAGEEITVLKAEWAGNQN